MVSVRQHLIVSRDIPCILCLILVVHPVLQKMQWNTQRSHTELSVQTELLKAEEVLANLLCEISTNKLLAAIVESTNTTFPSIWIEGRPLKHG